MLRPDRLAGSSFRPLMVMARIGVSSCPSSSSRFMSFHESAKTSRPRDSVTRMTSGIERYKSPRRWRTGIDIAGKEWIRGLVLAELGRRLGNSDTLPLFAQAFNFSHGAHIVPGGLVQHVFRAGLVADRFKNQMVVVFEERGHG